MLKPAEPNHEYFEEMAALAALGQISKEEYRQLREHLEVCEPCRKSLLDYMEILHEHLPVIDPQVDSFFTSVKTPQFSPGTRRRFLERAESVGIQFSPDVVAGKTQNDNRSWLQGLSFLWQAPRMGYAFGILLIGFILAGMSYQLVQLKSKVADKSKEIAKLTAEVARLEPYGSSGSVPLEADSHQDLTQAPTKSSRNLDAGGINPLAIELSRVRQNYQAAVARSRMLDDQLQEATAELASLRNNLSALQGKDTSSDKLRTTEEALRQATEELSRLRQDRASELAMMADQRVQIQKLTERLNSQGEVLDRHMELVATTQEIRDLMGARNLHIIDVADIDSRGTQKPFGRVFYTEGKSLVFYAYDLEKKRKSLERFAFQAWGQKESKAGSVQSLGVFSTDDQSQNRWVLKYDDPSVLAQIDSVFVTVEPKGGSMRPKGEQLMWAYLRANPNHP